MMEMRSIYDDALSDLLERLNKTIDNFSSAFDASYQYYGMKPLFSVADRRLNLIKAVGNASDYQVQNVCCHICCELSRKHGYITIEKPEIKNVAFYRMENSCKVGYFISFREEYMADLAEAMQNGISRLINIVLVEKLSHLKPNSHKYQSYPYKDRIKNITIKEFLDEFDIDEYANFVRFSEQYNYEAERQLGLTVSSLPTTKSIQITKEKIKCEFQSFFFENELSSYFSASEMEALRTHSTIDTLFDIEELDCIRSFLSSEWYYDLQVLTDSGLEQTAVVAGYFKSIEQLVFVIMLSLCDSTDFYLRTKRSYYDRTHISRLPLSKENQGELLTMAGELLSCIDYKDNIKKISTDISVGVKVQKYLGQYFKESRNGFFHKDNVYQFDEIRTIRCKTYCAFFLVAATYKVDNIISAISQTKRHFVQ